MSLRAIAKQSLKTFAQLPLKNVYLKLNLKPSIRSYGIQYQESDSNKEETGKHGRCMRIGIYPHTEQFLYRGINS